LDAPTAGQAVTVLHAIDDLDDEAPVAIGVCDTGFDFDPEALDRAVAAHDVVAFTLADAPGARRDPRAYGWLIEDDAGVVVDVRVKEAPTEAARAHPFAGVVFARRVAPLRAALRALIARDGRVRGELYLDSSLNDLLAAGGSVAAFPVDAAHLWGTPVDLATWWYAAAWWTRMAPDVYDAAEDPRLSRHAARWLAQGSLPNSLHGWVLGPTESP
jgi:bifunctional N-acetylglucosamine-1-phosphate-uridyltransferase/glucosamine-1-phosphate-acetyltransferase GlmU-like protein